MNTNTSKVSVKQLDKDTDPWALVVDGEVIARFATRSLAREARDTYKNSPAATYGEDTFAEADAESIEADRAFEAAVAEADAELPEVDGFAQWQAENGEIVTVQIDGDEVVDTGEGDGIEYVGTAPNGTKVFRIVSDDDEDDDDECPCDEHDLAPAPVASNDRIERMALAKTEAAALKAWMANPVGDKPATPNLDAINEGVPAMNPSKKSTSKKVAKVEVPRPTPGKGWAVIELRNTKHGEVVGTALAETGFESYVTGPYLVVKNAEANDVAARLVDVLEDTEAQFTSRLLTLALLWVRVRYPKATDRRTGHLTRTVDVLIERHQSGKVWDWNVEPKADATPRFLLTLTENGKTHTFDTLRALAEYLKVPASQPKEKATASAK